MVTSTRFKVGDIDACGLHPSPNPHVYWQWSEYHSLHIGNSLMFLYPPSQFSVIHVTATVFAGCNTTDPILNMNDGNSLFNVTSNGTFYFISGVSGHCEKNQKLQVSISTGSTAQGGGVVPAGHISPSSYPTVFGSIPIGNSSASSSGLLSSDQPIVHCIRFASFDLGLVPTAPSPLI